MKHFLQKISDIHQKNVTRKKYREFFGHFLFWRRKKHTIIGCILASIVMIKWAFPLAMIPGISLGETITKKNVNQLSETEISTEIETVTTKKTGLESQITNLQSDISKNAEEQGKIFETINKLEMLIVLWKKLEKSAASLEKIEKQIVSVDKKIAKSDKDSDKKTKETLEKQKSTVTTSIEAQIETIKKDYPDVTITLKTINTVKEERIKTSEELKTKKSELKTKKSDRKQIIRERTKMRKTISDASNYIKKLSDRAKNFIKNNTPLASNATNNGDANASGNNASGNNASGNNASGNNASGNNASGNNASGNNASGNTNGGNDNTEDDNTSDNNTNNPIIPLNNNPTSYLITTRTTATATANGNGTIANVTASGSGYVAAPPISVTGKGKCSDFPKATATVKNGMVESIRLSGGTCTGAPTLTISPPIATAKAVVEDNAATKVKITEGGFGYIGIPEVTVTATKAICSTPPTATAEVNNGIVTGIELKNGFCTGKPTLTIDPPTIPAKATVLTTGTGVDMVINPTVRIDEKGAGYVTIPDVKVTGTTCAILPRPIVTMLGDKISSISLVGLQKCVGVPKLTIDIPNKIAIEEKIDMYTPPANMYMTDRVTGKATIKQNDNDDISAIDYQGAGYIFAPKITFTGGNCSPHGIIATSVINNYGILKEIKFSGHMLDASPNCETVPKITIEPPISKAIGTIGYNGSSLVAEITEPGSGYGTTTPAVTLTNCPIDIKATATIADGKVTEITFSGSGTCTATPKITIAAPKGTGTKKLATAKIKTADMIVNMTNNGSGYVTLPSITVSDTCAKIDPSDITIKEGRIDKIGISGTCTKIPTISIEEPSIPAIATVTKTGTDTFSVKISKNAGYIAAPQVTVSGKCTLIPHALATVKEGRVDTITLTGAKGCTDIPKLTIDPPDMIDISGSDKKWEGVVIEKTTTQ